MRRPLAFIAILAGCSAHHGETVPPAARQAPPTANATEPPPTEPAPPEPPTATIEKPLARFGEGYPPPPAPRGEHGRIGSVGWGTWIQPKPDSGSLPLGGIRPGSSLPLVQSDLVAGRGKCRRFARTARGYVCVGKRSTLDVGSAFMSAARWTAPLEGAFPYEYALSVGAPMLTRPARPDEPQWRRTGDRSLSKMKGWAEGHDELAIDDPIEPNGALPDVLANGRSLPTRWSESPHVFFKKVPVGSMLAYTRAFEAHGETWVLSTNLTVVPTKGLKRFRPSSFVGVELDGDAKLPIAWMRKTAQPKLRRTESGFEPTGETWALRGAVGLTGREERWQKKTYLETREAGLWVERSGTRVARARDKGIPWEVKRGLSPNDKWIHVQVRSRTLVLHEGDRPVFATLISPGKQWATPFGRYFIESKHHVTTMTTEDGEPRKFWIDGVPWTMYFKRPYAIHGAYWHEDFGEEKSGGCVNLSPIDAKRVFEWAEPELPEGWGIVQGYTMGGGTFVLVEG